MTLQRLVLDYRSGELVARVLYRSEDAPNPGTKARAYFQACCLIGKGAVSVSGVALQDERTAEDLRRLVMAGIEAAAAGVAGDEGAREEALGRLRERAEEARKVYGEDDEVSVREITVPAYDPESRRSFIVGRFSIRDGATLRQDVQFALSEIRRRYATFPDHQRAMGERPDFRAYWQLSEEGAERGGYAELAYRPAEDAFLLQLHNGFEDELGPTDEDYVQDLLREAAGRTVYLESL